MARWAPCTGYQVIPVQRAVAVSRAHASCLELGLRLGDVGSIKVVFRPEYPEYPTNAPMHPPTACWLPDYEEIHRDLAVALKASPHTTLIVPIPPTTLAALRACASTESQAVRRGDDEVLQKLPSHLRTCLLPFQVEGLKFVVSRNGRAMLADEMGLGKTPQALASAQVCVPRDLTLNPKP
jgi:hypothetical protein